LDRFQRVVRRCQICTSKQIEFEPFKRRRVEANFDGGDVSSDGGLLLLRKLERRLGLIDAVARALADARDPGRIEHGLVDRPRQRVFGLAQGYADLNDHAALRNDVLMQTACERDTALAPAPTPCRLENRASRAAAWAIHEAIAWRLCEADQLRRDGAFHGSSS